MFNIKNTIVSLLATFFITAAASSQNPMPYPSFYSQTRILPGPYIMTGPIILFESGQFAGPPTGCGPVSMSEALNREAKVVDAIQVNIEPYCNDALTQELSNILNSIRMSENGGPGLEYGILDERCPRTYRDQAGWSAATIRKHLDRYIRGWTRNLNDDGTYGPGYFGPPRKMPQVFGVSPEGEPVPDFADFIDNLHLWYCLPGADNDPNGLNVNWNRNVKHFYTITRGVTDPDSFCAWK